MLEDIKGYASEYLYSEGPVLGLITLVALWLGYKISRRLVGVFCWSKPIKKRTSSTSSLSTATRGWALESLPG